MTKEFEILIPVIIQGGYDYEGWCVWLKEVTGNPYETFFRIVKFILDFPVTIIILILCLWSADLIVGFFLLKWFGFCDADYISIWKIFHPGQNYTATGIWWMWYTPLGALRSKLMYDPLIEPKDKNIYVHLYGKHYFKKGIITLREFQIQLAVGAVITFLVVQFNLISAAWHIFF